MSTADDKRAAAAAAVAEVQDGMWLGLGTGSTAAIAVDILGKRARAGLTVQAVCTSQATQAQALAAGIAVHDPAAVTTLDLAIDGADEIDPRLFAIKGAGGAMLREKVIASMARRMIVIADGSKRVAAIGAAKLPVETLPLARAFVTGRLVELGAHVELRLAGAEPYRTDNGNLVLDAHFGAMPDPRALAAAIQAIPGALGHGLFLEEVDAAYVATGGKVERLERP